MTHQSGIHANEYVITQLRNSHKSNIRALKIVIENESLVVEKSLPMRSSWKDDYDSLILSILDSNTPCYIFYKLDNVSELGHDWILINWVPDNATVREKMLYASTRATVRRQFGDHLIKEDITGNVKMAGGFYGMRQTLGSVSFNLTKEAIDVVNDFVADKFQYVQLLIDMKAEEIDAAVSAKHLEPNCISQHTPQNEARYHLYRFNFERDGDHRSALFFMHSISGYQSSVKSRMLYSTCKSSLVSQLEKDFGLQFSHRVETDNIEEITSEYLLDLLYPKPTGTRPKFDKPHGPVGRRPRKQLP